MIKATRTFLLITALLIIPAEAPADGGGDLAVVVNRETAVQALTSQDLRSILLGMTDRWPNGQKVKAASLPLDQPETRLILKQICGMSEGDFKRYFMQLIFRGQPASPPLLLRSSAALKALVRATPGAIGIIPVRDVDPSVTVVALDGGRPGSSNYKLAMSR